MGMDKSERLLYFQLFNEIGIIAQLNRAELESVLPSGISAPHFGVLNHLVRMGDGETPQQIARAFQVPKNSMTNTLAGLEARGLIKMVQNPNDKRSKQVLLTKRGQQFREQAIKSVEPKFKTFAQAFPPESLAELVPKLAAIREYLDKRRAQ